MVDLLAVHLALRNRALAVVPATTGSTSLSATATGYHRAAGSFVTDGFKPGMEFTPTGFATNTVDVIKSVTASDLETMNARAVEAEASGRTIAVGFPAMRAWENDSFTPDPARPYAEEDFEPGTQRLITQAATGKIHEDGLYVIKRYGLLNFGVAALRKEVDALKALFTPGTTLTAGSHVVTIRTDVSPQTGRVTPLTSGHAVLVLTIPWYARSTNAIAA